MCPSPGETEALITPWMNKDIAQSLGLISKRTTVGSYILSTATNQNGLYSCCFAAEACSYVSGNTIGFGLDGVSGWFESKKGLPFRVALSLMSAWRCATLAWELPNYHRR